MDNHEELTTRDLADVGREQRQGNRPAARSAEEAAASRDRQAAQAAPEPPAGQPGGHIEHAVGGIMAGAQGTMEVQDEAEGARLLGEDRRLDFSRRWDAIQASFVDEPRQAVELADRLVADVIQELANTFAREREALESQWTRGEDVSTETEDLRVGLQRYRAFFAVLARF